MRDHLTKSKMSRRAMLGGIVQTAIVSCVASSDLAAQAPVAEVPEAPLNGIAGIDRVTVLQGKTYLRGWAGYGNPPGAVRGRGPAAPAPVPSGPAPTATWSKASGPGTVNF